MSPVYIRTDMTNRFGQFLHGRYRRSFFACNDFIPSACFRCQDKISLPYLDGVRVAFDTTCIPIRLFSVAALSVPFCWFLDPRSTSVPVINKLFCILAETTGESSDFHVLVLFQGLVFMAPSSDGEEAVGPEMLINCSRHSSGKCDERTWENPFISCCG